ncbi:MAG TPA: hypothetical protein VFZ61_26770, partial [Polyangiales bacterium]
MEIACPQCGLMRTVEDAASVSSMQHACRRCAERAELLGADAVDAQRDSEGSLPRRGEWHVLLRGLQ